MKEVNIVIISSLTSVTVLLIFGGIVMHYYKVLKINKDASQNDIKQAYRGLAKEHHPDKAPGKEREFQNIKEANDILSDEQLKDLYDQYLEHFGNEAGHKAFIRDYKLTGHNIEKLKAKLKMRLDSHSSNTSKDKNQSTSRDVHNPNLPIHQAIEQNRYEAALELIKHAELSDINAKNKFGQQTPLHLAIATQHLGPNIRESKRIDIINALIKKGADMNAQDKDGETAVHYIVRWVINNGTDKKVKAWVYFNMNTGKVENRDIISILLSIAKCGANVNIEDNKGNTALSYIIKARYVIHTPLYRNTWVEERAWKEEWDIIKSLLKVGACIETQEAVSLMLKASIKNKYDLETVKLLMSSSKTPFDINYKDKEQYTALMIALEGSRFDMVQFLIKKGLDIKSEQNKKILISAMMNFVRWEKADSLDMLLSDPLLKEAINIDARKEFVDGHCNVSVLEMAALKGNIPALKVLSKHKTNANSKVAKSSGGTGCAVLHRLAMQYNKEDTQVKKNQIKNVMGLLVLLFNADLTLRDDYGNTPLDYSQSESLKKSLEEDIINLRDDINKGYGNNATDFILQSVERVQPFVLWQNDHSIAL